MRYAPTWRERKYSDDPYMNNFALYAEDKISISLSSSMLLEFQGGLRSDITHIRQSEYGTAANLSPRFNAKYTFLRHNSGTISDVAVYAGWGKTVKLPSFEVLYPSPSYQDKLAFAPGTLADGSTFYAYYTYPDKPQYNPALKWQSSRQWEIGVEANLKWVKVSLSAFSKKTYDPYMRVNTYVPYTYKLTEQEALNNCPIPSQNRIYSIDQNTGVVTVTDKTGAQESVQLSYTERNTFKSIPTFTNGSPVERKGLEWIVDFAQIPALRTSFRLDGNYYYYRGVDETLIAGMPNSSYTMADGRPYQYVGYYIGSNSTSTATSAAMSSNNGSLSKQLNTNLTITTHIPKIRLILSMKIEAAFYNYKRYLSEYSGGNRGIVIDSPENYTGSNTDIYNGDNYVAVYPLYYSTWDDPDTKIPFAEKFIWAKDNDPALYNELVKLVVKTTRDYYFRPNKISSYYSANLSVTKEIGNKASLSFFATNFINNMALVKSSWDGTSSTLYNSGYIPQFYYGLSLRLKL
jgi:outer membrane receptor protein involved in Fe transport